MRWENERNEHDFRNSNCSYVDEKQSQILVKLSSLKKAINFEFEFVENKLHGIQLYIKYPVKLITCYNR